MNSDQVGGIVRAILAGVGLVGVLLGLVSAETWATVSAQVSGPLTTIVFGVAGLTVFYWSWRTNSTKQMAISVSEKPEIQRVVSRELAPVTPDAPKVVSH